MKARGRRGPVAVVGTLPAVQPGERLLMRGQWRTDRLHGAQFCPESAEIQPPSAVDDIVRYLGSGLIREIGPILAKRIVGTFGERTLEVLDSQPDRVREVPGIGPQRAQSIAAGWVDHRALREVSAFLSAHKLDARIAPRLVQAYGADAPKALATNPYRLVGQVPGFGFLSADRLGQDLAIRPTAPARLQAAAQAVLIRASELGHTRQTYADLVAATTKLTDVDESLAADAVAQLVAEGTIASRSPGPKPVELLAGLGPSIAPGLAPRPEAVRASPHGVQGQSPWQGQRDGVPQEMSQQGGRVGSEHAYLEHPQGGAKGLRLYEPTATYEADPLGLGLAGLVQAEESLASRLLALANRPTRNNPTRTDAWLAADPTAQQLSPEQRAAVEAAAAHSLFVLTGGPGVGKTTTVRVLVGLFQALGRTVALAAPTGKAAKRLGDVVGLEAKTLHRLLGAAPQGFRHGPREPLPHDVVIVDEASMLDTQLARAVAGAVGRDAQLVLVGDADQLPSVGPGQVLRDLLASGHVPHARLETVFRQAAESQIVVNAHRIRRGEPLDLPGPAALGSGIDLVFVPAPGARAAEIAADWAVRRLPRATGLEPGDIQVLAPLTRVCQTLNNALQGKLNPADGQPERPHGAIPLRVGDRVIQTRNNYGLGVFNGDQGVVAAIALDRVSVDFGEGRLLEYTPADLIDLDHAYCLTVHRSQGSEWPGVVIVASSSHGPILSRNLLYTALTRAKRAAVIVGDHEALARAIANTRDQSRTTALASLLTQTRPMGVQGAEPPGGSPGAGPLAQLSQELIPPLPRAGEGARG